MLFTGRCIVRVLPMEMNAHMQAHCCGPSMPTAPRPAHGAQSQRTWMAEELTPTACTLEGVEGGVLPSAGAAVIVVAAAAL